MNRIVVIIFASLFTFVSSISSSTALTNVQQKWTNSAFGTPTAFKVKPINMTLCESFNLSTGACTGTNDVLFTPSIGGDGICDIAAVEPGAVACSASGTASIPKNVTFNYMRVLLDRTMWISGSVSSTGAEWQSSSGGGAYDGSVSSCVTSSSNTNTNGTSAPEGAITGTPSEQAIYFVNAPGNDTEIGNASNSSWATARGNDSTQACEVNWTAVNMGDLSTIAAPCAWIAVDSLDNAGYTSITNTANGEYTYYTDYSGTWSDGENAKIWQGGLTASSEGFVMIYKLTSPYTRTSDIDPLLKMSFDVTNALRSQFVKFDADENASSTEWCSIDVGNPTVTITITD
tara:strand:+ start:1164 stop:2198 length:1035 start_codon:yes stop_codon:yes gene_type:complete